MHRPVLLKETLSVLEPKPAGRFIDATFGAGGHSRALLEKIGPRGKVLGIDANHSSIKDAVEGQSKNPSLILVQGNFRHLREIARQYGFQEVDGVLFDLGLSSEMLDDPKRGFSFQQEGPLDMRFDQSQKLTAFQLVNEWPEKELIRIFKEYGEERFARRIAQHIIRNRKNEPVSSTRALFSLIQQALPASFRHRANHTARRIFQALRIAVNDELNSLQEALPQTLDLLRKGGRLAVISFHSLEDRIVKRFFQEFSRDCVCPPEFPKCVCERKPALQVLTKKPIVPSKEEIAENPRAKSAKLRAAVKI